MKKWMLTGISAIAAFALHAQTVELPNTEIKDVKSGRKVAFNQTVEKGKVTLINFWATWCVPCKKEIAVVMDSLSSWKSQADFNYMTVSIDESRAEGLVRSYAISKKWDFPYYMDANSDLKRSLNFQQVPFTVIVDKDGKVAYMHTGYEAGAENEVFAKVKELASK